MGKLKQKGNEQCKTNYGLEYYTKYLFVKFVPLAGGFIEGLKAMG